ncbi:MAG: NAD-dependent epimerase/dehydratase family protein [Bacteroidota bacterium]|nr:NAD-dependent epimerase/dehydratase family protein [Bacteroidota bacterium]
MQTILGSGGAIGVELAKALSKFTTDIRLVSRNPKKVNTTDTLFAADVTIQEQIEKAIQGSTVCYVTVGFEYKTKVWQERLPAFIKHVVETCIKHETKLVFFDNVYAIGGDNVKHITENSPVSPSSKKGEIRAAIDQHIIQQVEKGKLNAVIARSPDFFGPIKGNSLMMNMVYDNMVKGKSAQWFCNADVIHSMGYAHDLAEGTAILGNSPQAFNQIWNLPVDKNALTGKQWVKLFADEMHASDKVQVLPAFGMRVLGLLVPIIKEIYEMRYQFDREYYFDSSKFINAFAYTPTTNKEAIQQTIAALR